MNGCLGLIARYKRALLIAVKKPSKISECSYLRLKIAWLNRSMYEEIIKDKEEEALTEEDLDFLAESAYADACRPGNPKETSVADLKELFRKLM